MKGGFAMNKFLPLFVAVCAALSAAAAKPVKAPPTVAELQVQVKGLTLPAPYEPSAPNQLLTLGKADKSRFAVKDISWPAKPGDAEVCLWKDDKVAALSITIDDNCAPDHAWWLEQCRKHNFKVTFFVVAASVEKNPKWGGRWSDWRDLFASGCVSLQSHSINHQGHDDKRPVEEVRLEYAGSRAMIDANVPGARCLCLAYPNGNGNQELASKYFIACRGVYGVPNAPNRIDYMSVNKGQLSEPCFEVITTGKASGGEKWLNNPGFYRGWCATLCHAVQSGTTPEKRAASAAGVAATLDKLATYSDRIWEDFFVDVAKYGQERDSATLKTVSSSPDRIELSLTDLMLDSIFDYPLTVKVRLPDAWTSVSATQSGKPVVAKFVKHGNASYALVAAVPDRGPIVLGKN